MKIKIYSYTDYREFLRDYYLSGKLSENKESVEEFSFRALSARFGFTSSNYFKLIIDKKRHLGRKSVAVVAEAIGLKKLERDYFSHLVFFDKAKDEVDRNYHFAQIVRIRSGKDFALVENAQLALYEQWYTPVIRELITGKSVESLDCSAIARSFMTPIHHKQVRHSIDLLLELELIAIKEGVYRQLSPILDTGNEVSSYAIKQFHKTMIGFGSDSIEKVQRENREISSVTMRVSDEGFSSIKARVQQFRTEILQIIADDKGGDALSQLNFQLFPLLQEDSNA